MLSGNNMYYPGGTNENKSAFYRFINIIATSPPVKAVGNFLYSLGFSTEAILVKIWRFLRDASSFLAQVFVWLFSGAAKGVSKGFRSFIEDLTSPFVRISENFIKARETRNNRREQAVRSGKGAGTAAAQLGYFGSGVKSVFSVVINILRYLLPFAAVAVLVITVNSLLGYRYTLAVEMDGKLIGYISDEMVLQDSINVVKGRIKASDGKTGEDWKPEGISLRVSNVGSVTNKSQLINNMLHAYSDMSHKDDALIVASGLMINGELYAITTEPEKINMFLQGLLDAGGYGSNPDVSVSFVKGVEMQTGSDDDYYYSSSISSYDDIIEELSRIEHPAVYHIVSMGETAESIAMNFNLTLDQLSARNGGIDILGEDGTGQTALPEGMQLIIERDRYFLQVKKTMEVSYEEEVPFSIVEQTTDKKVKGSRVKVKNGENGRDLVYDELVYIDGELVDRVRLSEKTQRVTEPVDEVWEIGTFVFTSGIEGYIDAYLWPVHNYNRLSRGWIPGGVHSGLDITASAGTPIHASNYGEVVRAGWWSTYGNCVMIEHPDGWRTLYAHMSAIGVSEGDVVDPNQIIGYVGNTGRSFGNHCHFEIWINGSRTDPAPYVAQPPSIND